MAIYVGDKPLVECYANGRQVQQIYRGSKLIWEFGTLPSFRSGKSSHSGVTDVGVHVGSGAFGSWIERSTTRIKVNGSDPSAGVARDFLVNKNLHTYTTHLNLPIDAGETDTITLNGINIAHGHRHFYLILRSAAATDKWLVALNRNGHEVTPVSSSDALQIWSFLNDRDGETVTIDFEI